MLTEHDDAALLQPTFVDGDFFLVRIHEFEKKYGKTWLEFWTALKNGTLDNPCNPDYGQWAVLCRAYWTELLAEMVDPPHDSDSATRPEHCSGFSILAFAI